MNSSSSKQTVERNKALVKAFYHEALNNKDFAAAEKYIGAYYKQHNPLAADGKEGFKQYIDYLRDHFPHARSKIIRMMAEEDYVILHVHAVLVPEATGQAIIDIFRLENDKIVEHWDVIQDVPVTACNENTMF